MNVSKLFFNHIYNNNGSYNSRSALVAVCYYCRADLLKFIRNNIYKLSICLILIAEGLKCNSQEYVFFVDEGKP